MENNSLLKYDEEILKRELIPYRKKDKWGFCTSDKKIIIDCEYDDAYPFTDGLARVQINDKSGFVDKKGNIIIPCIYDSNFPASYWGFSDGCILVHLENYFYFLNNKGKRITAIDFEDAQKFGNGLAAVKLNGKWGYIDTNGNQKIEFKYEMATSFSKFKEFAVVKHHDKFWFIDRNGNLVKEYIYDTAYTRDFSEDLLLVKNLYDQWGYINIQGDEIIPCMYGYGENFSEGLAAVELNEKWGYIDKNAHLVIPYIYQYATNFSEGLAAVIIKGKSGFINTKAVEIIPCIYEYANSFSEGLAAVKLNNKWGFINKQGNQVIGCKYDWVGWFYEGMADVVLGGKRGYIDYNGNEIIPCVYDTINIIGEVGSFSKGIVRLFKKGKVGYANDKGVQYWED